jgi:hypothetical protein
MNRLLLGCEQCPQLQNCEKVEQLRTARNSMFGIFQTVEGVTVDVVLSASSHKKKLEAQQDQPLSGARLEMAERFAIAGDDMFTDRVETIRRLVSVSTGSVVDVTLENYTEAVATVVACPERS